VVAVSGCLIPEHTGRGDGSCPVCVGAILRAYGIDWPTEAERRAYVGVLDRMGAFSPSERAALRAGGLL
jgi:hypothetical protein